MLFVGQLWCKQAVCAVVNACCSALLRHAVLCCAVQLQGYLSHPRTISSHHFGAGLLTGEVLPANSRLVSKQSRSYGELTSLGWLQAGMQQLCHASITSQSSIKQRA